MNLISNKLKEEKFRKNFKFCIDIVCIPNKKKKLYKKIIHLNHK
jgi:hypothetical protein